MIKIGLVYVRQSRHRDYKRTVSPQVQEEGCRSLPIVVGCDKVEVFKDLDKSGKSAAGRKGFQAFLKRLEADPPYVVAVYDQSRSFRNVTEALEFRALLVDRLPHVNVAVVHGSFDRTVIGKFGYTSLAAAREMERDIAAEKMRDTYHYLAAQGEMVGQVPPGYLRDSETGAVTIDEEVAVIIRRIFDMYATGQFSVRNLAHRLNAEGVRIPSLPNGFKGDTIAQTLANVAYIGKTYSGKRRQRQGELIDGKWEPVIDMDVWKAVERQLSLKRPSGGRSHQGGARHYVFGKLLRHQCGRKLHATTIKGHAYYRCDGTSAAEPCRGVIRESTLLPWAQDLFEILDQLQPPGFEAEVERQVTSDTPFRSPGALAQIKATLERLEKMLLWGDLPEARYRAERKRLEALRGELSAPTLQPSIVLADVLAIWNQADARVRRDLLGALFDELDVWNGRIVGYKPRQDHAAEVVALMERVHAARRTARGLSMVGREGVEPPQLSRRFYRPLGSPHALCRPTAALARAGPALRTWSAHYGTQPRGPPLSGRRGPYHGVPCRPCAMLPRPAQASFEGGR
jgi:DNA invertase Pin-like site-specific DNA recombinase